MSQGPSFHFANTLVRALGQPCLRLACCHSVTRIRSSVGSEGRDSTSLLSIYAKGSSLSSSNSSWGQRGREGVASSRSVATFNAHSRGLASPEEATT